MRRVAAVGVLVVALASGTFVVAVRATRDGESAEAVRVVRLSFVLQGRFSRHGVVAAKGPHFHRFVRLVELPLPAAPPRSRSSDRCHPGVLTIVLSNGVRRDYGPCRRPPSLVRVAVELCRQLTVAEAADCERLRREVAAGEPV